MKRSAKIITLASVTIMVLSSIGIVYATSTMQQASWYYGNGAPTEHKSDGSFYIDLSTNNVYQSRKLECGDYEWVLIAFGSGRDGVDGNDGKDGASWLFGATNPTSNQGAKGDLYLNIATWDVFAKVDSTWTLLGNIKGQDGMNGLNGKDGINGTNGVNGINGIDGIDGLDGRDGISGLNGTNGTNGVNGLDGLDGRDGINGLNGINGTNGLNGRDGINGTNGLDGRDGLNFNSTGTVLLYNGTDGMNGVNGTNGLNGKDGINGANGLNGIDGMDGADGVNGANGKSGVDGLTSVEYQIPNVSSYEIPWWFFAVLAVGLIGSLTVILYAFVTGCKKPA